MHVYDFLANKENRNHVAYAYLDVFTRPAVFTTQDAIVSWLMAQTISTTYNGKRYYLVGASRLGDIWLAKSNIVGRYDIRVDLEDCTNWLSGLNVAVNLHPPCPKETRSCGG